MNDPPKALVAGWFSFEMMGATAGDLMACDVAVDWLKSRGYECDVAAAPAFPGGVDWTRVDPLHYSLVIFVCGPLGNGEPATSFLQRFGSNCVVGLNLSMLHPVEDWNPFDLLLERDSSRAARPDISFAHKGRLVPVIGLVRVHEQKEYAGGEHRATHEMIDRSLASRDVAVVPIDTCFDPPNQTGLHTPAQVESLIAAMDAVVTTRLHGMVLALKNGVPPLAIDPIPGGAKIKSQADAIGWPLVFTADLLTEASLGAALDRCLESDSKREAAECARRAKAAVARMREELTSYLSTVSTNDR